MHVDGRVFSRISAITLLRNAQLFSFNFHYLLAFKSRIILLIQWIIESLNPNIIPKSYLYNWKFRRTDKILCVQKMFFLITDGSVITNR